MNGKETLQNTKSQIEIVGADFSEDFLLDISLYHNKSLTLISRGKVFIGFVILSIVLGLWVKPLFWLGIPGIFIIALQLYRIRFSIDILEVSQIVENSTVKKGKPLNYKIIVKNKGNISTPPFRVIDETQYLNYKDSNVTYFDSINRNQEVTILKSPRCESPSGPLRLFPLRFEIQDELGLFKTTKTIGHSRTIQVVNRQVNESKYPIRRPENSNFSGDLEIPKAGSGISLFGLREYRDGDSLNLISWAHSTLDDEFFVKEFEADVARRVAIFLSSNSDSQYGYGASSTWEISKTLVLELAKGYLNANATVSLYTNDISIKDLGGRNSIHLLEKYLVDLNYNRANHSHQINETDFFRKNHPEFEQSEIEKIYFLSKAPCLYYYITSNIDQIDEIIPALLKVRDRGYEPCLVYVDPYPSALLIAKHFRDISVFTNLVPPMAKNTLARLMSVGIPMLWASSNSISGEMKVASNES